MYHKELEEGGGAIARGMIKKYCEDGADCAFRHIYDELGRESRLPMGLAPSNVDKVKQIIERVREKGSKSNKCWEYQDCPPERRDTCPAFLKGEGHYCWVTSKTCCEGEIQGGYVDKISQCEKCDFYKHRKRIK
jgi:hypothetical protein